jgi:hypothetical protein
VHLYAEDLAASFSGNKCSPMAGNINSVMDVEGTYMRMHHSYNSATVVSFNLLNLIMKTLFFSFCGTM